MKRLAQWITAWVLAACLLFAVPAMGEAVLEIIDIQKYGNLILSITGTDFLNAGYTYGDIVEVAFAGRVYDMPVGTSYSDVDEGAAVCRVVIDPEEGADAVVLAINMGDLATESGIAVKSRTEDEVGYRWDYLTEEPVEVSISMKEMGGYLNDFLLRRLVRTNERSDYSHLTDAEFANFRMIATTGMGQQKLYRSSSPINPEIGRSLYADHALAEAGIRTVINLADLPEEAMSYEGYNESSYASCDAIMLGLGVDVHTEEFRLGLAQGLRFLAEREGPYLLHCNEGKDRAGFVSAVLECLMGATAQEVLNDYMTTFIQYYGVERGSEQYQVLAEKNIGKSLMAAFEIESLTDADLAAEAEAYLMDVLEMSKEEVEAIRERLR